MKSPSFLSLLIFIVMTAASVEGAAANGTPIERGLAWLAQAQETDGSWGKRLDLQATAFSILALEAAGRDCAADVAHLRREVYGSPYELALQLLGTRESVIAERLLALREPDGGWGDLYTTALALMGLARAGRTDQAAAAYLLDRQNPDGSWGLEGTNEMTAVVTYALVSTGYAGAATDRALAWLREHQTPQGGFAHPTATAWAILALRGAAGNEEAVARAASWLRNARLPDGGWGWGKEPHGALYPTALIVRALAALDPGDPAVEAGAVYLEARRNNDAGWYDRGLAAETTLRVAEILAALGRRDALAAVGRWMEKLVPLNQAARAARFSFLLRYASIAPEEKSRILAEFLAAEGPAGGWGCAPGYESDLLTTSMVLRALWDAGYADPGIYRRTVEFIRGRQRADGGFNLMPGEPGQIYVTAHLLLTLARLRPLAAVEAVTEPAAAWLLAERRADGSWGRGALETAMAFAAVADRLGVGEAEETRRYLELAQETDGSWENDALVTASVLAALDLMRPNPRVTAEGIAFAPQVVYYRDPAAVTVTVENGGLAAAENLVVRLHLGEPGNGTVLGTEVIPVIPARETRSVTFPWNADILGANRFTVTLDPEEVLRETREDDNVAAKILRVLPKIDLAASSEDLHITPEDPSPAEILTIRAVVRNLGCLPAGEFTVAFYDAAPEAGGRLIGTVTCAGLPAGGAIELTVATTLAEGEYNIYAVVDPENLVAEDDEGNNLAFLVLTVRRRIDLSINTQNIIFSNEEPMEGDVITIYATVANRREDAAEAVPVAFYLGNPANGGVSLGRAIIDYIAGNGTGLAVCTFDTTGLSGPQVIYVTVDPDGALAEVDEHNNQALNVVYVTPRPDLVVTGITAGTMTEGVPGSISITIKNDGGSTAGACKVRLALDDASLADVLGDVALGVINPGATATINLTLDTVALAGAHVIYVKVDAANEVNEKNETNNTAAASFTINPAPELSVEPAEISFVSPGKKRVIEHIATKDDSYISAIDAGGTNYNTCTNAKLAVAGGTPVTISVWARGARGGEAIELILFEYPGPAASGRILASKTFNITAEWREYSLTVVTGTNAVAAWGRLDNNLKDQVVYWCDPRLLNADFTDGFAFVRTSDTYLLRFFTANNGTCRIEPSVGFPQAIHEGDEVAVNILVRNNTSAAANNVPVRLERYADGGWETLSTLSVSVPGSQGAFATFGWDSRGHVGANRFRAVVDPQNQLYERNKANNLAEKELVVEPAVLPDLAVTSGSIAVHPRPAARDGVYALQAEIRNLRSAGVKNVPVSFYRGHPMAGGVLIGEATVDVAGGGSTIAEVAWETAGFLGWQAIYVWVDPLNTVTEYDDYNNLASAAFRLRSSAPYQPQNLRAEAVLNDVNLAWDPVDQPDVIGYLLYRDGVLINPKATAVRGEAHASSQYSSSYAAVRAVDGNTGTYWLSGSFTAAQWFEEEFAAMQFIEEIEIAWQTGYIGRDYQVQVWDGARYETVLGVTGNTATVRVHKLAEAGLAIRRYRILITRSNAGYVGIAEVKLKARAIITETEYRDASLTSGEYFYNVTSLNQQSEESLPSAAVGVTVLPPAGPADFTARVQGPDVLLSWEPGSSPDLLGYYLRRDGIFLGGTEPTAGTASACGYYSSSYTPEKALDGNESTFWYLASLPSDTWWQMTLPAKRYLSAITINWRYQPQDFQILGWQNGAWMLLAEIKNNTKTVTSFDFAQRPKLEAIRIKITRSSYGYVGINEVLLTVQKRLTDCAYLDENLKAGFYSYSLTAENGLFCESEPVRTEAKVLPPVPPFALQAEVAGWEVVLSWSHQQTPGLAGYLILRNGAIVNRNQLADCISSGTVSASSRYSDTYAPAKAADGNTGTYWLSAGSGYPAWFEVTFRKPKILAGLRLLWHASYYGRDYQIQYRCDGQWVAVASVRGNQASDITHDFAHLVLTDGIRIYCTAGVNTSYLGILELAVYENVLDTVMSHRDPALPDGRYEYAVAARDKAGNQSAASAPILVEVGNISSPYNLTGTAVENRVMLRWEIPRLDGIAGFRIYRDYVEVNPETNIANTASLAASHNSGIVTRITDGNLNTYWYPGGNIYPASIEMSLPAAVEIDKIGVHWYAAAYAARDYDLFAWVGDTWVDIGQIRGNTGANNEITFGRILTTNKIKLVFLAGPSYIYLAELRVYGANLVKDLSYTDTVRENRIYTYFVRAVSDTGTLSAASNIVQVEVAERTPPAVPGDFRVTEGNGFLRLQWTANTEPDLAGYYIYLGDSGQPLNSSLLSKTAVQFDYSLPAATKEFTFKLVAVDINGNRSAPAEAVFVFSPPLAPQNPRATVSGRRITFTWSPSPSLNLFGYKIYRNGLLLNNLQKLTPNSVMASSYYFGNSSYAPAKVNDNNESTYWRPAIEDPAPYLELGFGAKKMLSAIMFTWHAQDEIPESYSIQVFADGAWVTVFTGDGSVKRTIYLLQIMVTDRIRLVIEDVAAWAGLAEFAGYEAARITSTTHTSTDLTSGRYTYHVSAVNVAGLESAPTQPVEARISAKDLSIKPGDLYYSPYRPSVFDNVTFSVKVTNTGLETVGEVPVAIYAGDPAAGGVLLGEVSTPSLGPGEECLLQYVWDPSGFAGEYTINVKIDPRNQLNEFDETNNVTSRDITITSTAVLEVKVVDVAGQDFPRIKVGFQVNDAMGEGVAGLRKANLRLFEDGTPQDILALSSIVDDTGEAAQIDLVFVIDTSGSMDDEWLVLPGIIRDLTETLTRVGIDLRTKVYSLQVVRTGIPGVEALTQGIFKGNIIATSMECWGPGTAWVAAYYPWRPGAYRIVIPISDEDCYQGVGQDANDLASIAEATEVCRANNVEAYPFYGFSDTGQSVKGEMQTLAQGTGGEMFFFQEANQVVNYLLRVLSQKIVHYYLEYETTNISRGGTLRTVAVEASYRQAVGSGQGQYRAPQDSFGDLVITRFEADPVSAEDEVCLLRALVGNAGGVRVENAEAAFFLGDPRAGGIPLEAKVLPALEPNATITLAVPWRSRAGEHRFYLVLDPGNEITETSEENNEACVDLFVPGPGKPDLLVTSSGISFTQENPSCGQRIGIAARIRNIGSPSGPAEVGFYLGDPAGGGVLLGSSAIPCLDYLGYYDVACFWTAGIIPGEYAVWVLVDPLDAIEEEDEDNNKASRLLTVYRRGVAGRIEADKAIYQPMEDALLAVAILNNEAAAWTGAARVVIKDGAGKVLADVAHFQLALDGGGEWRQSFIWNTGRAAPGGYLACLELYENEDLFAEYAAEFAVAPSRAAGGRLATDKSVYAPMEKAAITVDLWNTGVNTHLRDLLLEVTVKNSSGEEIWTDRAAVAYLPVGEGQVQVFHWPIERSESGEYTVFASLGAADGAGLWSAARTVTVAETALLAGSLSVTPRQTQAGREVEFAYTVTNNGNKRLDPLPLRIMLVHPETKEIGMIIAEELAMEPGETYAGAANRTIDLPDARYMAVMQAVVDEAAVPLSSAGLLVDSTPPVTTAGLSDLRLVKDGVFYGVIGSSLTLTAFDNLVGVAETVYDLGQGQVDYEGPIVFSTEGVYEIGFRSVDRLGNAEDWKSMRIVIDQTPPVVRILAPAEGEEVPPDFDAVVEAFDNLGLQLAELHVDGEKRAEFTASPVEITLSLPPGPHTLRARALDLAGFEAWTPPVGIRVAIPDTIPPATTAVLQGERMYCGAYRPGVTVTLTAMDNEGGRGVAGIYYRLDGGEESLYTGPFLVEAEGRHTLSYYAVDHAGNREERKTLEFRIVKPWSAPYGLLCRSLKAKGRAGIGSTFVNGPVDLGGCVHLGYLGTTERCIRKTHGVEIGRLETGRPYLPLPEPDWAALRAAARLRPETRIKGNVSLSDVRFAKELYLSGRVRITGLLVVEGNLTIAGHLELTGAVYCRGKVKVTGCAAIEGLLYAGCGLEAGGTLDLHGAAVVDGPVNLHGRVTVVEGPIEDYSCWLRPGKDGCWCHGPHRNGRADGHQDGGHRHDDDPCGRQHKDEEDG